MTIGIYRLCFNGTDSCYIGQSTNIESRFKKHISDLKLGKCTEKMLYAYTTYGEPTLEILIECKVSELNAMETEAIEIFDSYKNGFNTLEIPGKTLGGQDHPNSKFSNDQIIETAKLLTDINNSYSSISEKTGVSVAVIKYISTLEAHGWLEEVIPEIYKKLQEIKPTRNKIVGSKSKNSAASRGIIYPPIKSPDGIIYSSIGNISIFSKEHNLTASAVSEVLHGKRKSHKGWRLAHNG